MPEASYQIKGSVPRHHHQLLGPCDASDHIEFTVKLKRKSEDGLPTLDEFIAGKRAVGLTRKSLEEKNGASEDAADAVRAWARQQGLSVAAVDLGKRDMRIVGTIAAVEKAFQIHLQKYRHMRLNVDFRCPDKDVSVPESLSKYVMGVIGLNDMPVVVRNGARVARNPQSADPKTLYPGSFYPNEVAKLYGFPQAQGKGQRVAILEFGGGFNQNTLANYFSKHIGLAATPTVNPVSVLGTQMNINDGATGEVYLDIEVVGAMAPQATIDVFFAPWTGRGYLAAIEQAVHNDDYAAVSISYGIDEDLQGDSANPGWPALNQLVDEAFREAAALGVPLFVSSGDQGSSCLRGQLQNGEEITLYAPDAHVSYPCSSPYATAVGGTLLFAQNGAIKNEVIWNELGALIQKKYYLGGATGGGVSDRYPAPSYQTGAGVKLTSANPPNKAGRCVPDVAGNAGVASGYLVSQPPGSQVSIAPVGGTSAAAPMWAALTACVREALTTANGAAPAAFFFNDFVYANGKSGAFRTVGGGIGVTYNNQGQEVLGAVTVVGDNISTEVKGYSGANGYNLCCGWGAPNGQALLNALSAWLKTQPKAPAASA